MAFCYDSSRTQIQGTSHRIYKIRPYQAKGMARVTARRQENPWQIQRKSKGVTFL